MSKTQQRERSTLTNDQINQLKEAESIMSDLIVQTRRWERQLDAGLISKDRILELIETWVQKNYDRYNDLVHEVELAHGTSIYFLGYQDLCLKDWQFLDFMAKLI